MMPTKLDVFYSVNGVGGRLGDVGVVGGREVEAEKVEGALGGRAGLQILVVEHEDVGVHQLPGAIDVPARECRYATSPSLYAWAFSTVAPPRPPPLYGHPVSATTICTFGNPAAVMVALIASTYASNMFMSKEYWTVVISGVAESIEGVALTDAQLKDLKAKNYLFQAIDRSILETILCKNTAKDIWDSMKKKYQDLDDNEKVQQPMEDEHHEEVSQNIPITDQSPMEAESQRPQRVRRRPEFKKSMMVEFEMSDLGMMHYFIGMKVVQSTKGIFISQKKYVQEILDRFQMKDCNPVSTPTEFGLKLNKDHEGKKVDSTIYKQIVGSLMYLTATRPDIMYYVSLISRYMENPTEIHLLAAKRILRYLQGTKDFGLFYKKVLGMKMSTTAICFELLLLASCLLFSSVFPVAFGAKTPRIHPNEKNLLKRISTKLNIDWNFELDPCSRIGNWSFQGDKSVERKVDCDCSFNSNSVCHIVNISLKAQNLSGAIPKEFGSLRYLQQLDLSRNVLNGTVPDEWKNMRLQGLSLMGNRLSGPFPLVLTKITSLTNVYVFLIQEHMPLALLVHLVWRGEWLIIALCRSIERVSFMGHCHRTSETFVISSNNFTGEIPRELAEMTNLTDLRISNTNLTGRLPDFVKLLKKLEKLHIQGCRLEGPIPSGISYLTSLNDLRISDLRGNISSAFPDLGDMETLKTLILRNCSIRGNIPPYIGDMEKLKNLDLSFNQLSGEIPSSFSKLQKVDFIYLTGNLLTDQYSLHINCGGKEVTVNGIKYEADTEERGASELYLSTNWAFSSTGNFMDNDIDADNYIAKNLSELSMPNSQLYTRARLSPLSLTYYGLCLMKGCYTVKLHFAEIVFTDDNTFQSLGKRVFNVFIQDNLVLEDFNIEDAARGSGKPIIKSFNASVSDNTLKIKFYWSGKGTTGIPSRGIYGPLISAISVTPSM
ncbi:hypothetical protein ZIOFF_063827 [Zingiber officinale]|uniref:non-specific serine/threonine protein kinase n=1 Tax=Zingiber officinale TaxID=94328 RepID=A0A8J5KHR7_ZINOF|nr:hypothetical protein ZIOFF_063827 [Zingiber officinale]